jgi:hypothetical protein
MTKNGNGNGNGKPPVSFSTQLVRRFPGASYMSAGALNTHGHCLTLWADPTMYFLPSLVFMMLFRLLAGSLAWLKHLLASRWTP